MVGLEMTTVTVVVTDSKLYGRTGDVGRWAARVEEAYTAHAIAEAPHGGDQPGPGTRGARWNKSFKNEKWPVGSLKANISGEVERVAVRHLITTVTSGAPYSIYVLKGTGMHTGGFIKAAFPRNPKGQFTARPKGRWGMYLPRNLGFNERWVPAVRGQEANNFLERAFAATARTHSSLRGFDMVGSF